MNVNDWPGLRVTGTLAPAILNAAPEMVAEFTVAGEVPVDRSVRDSCTEVPIVTLPKLREFVLAVSCELAGAVPVPDNATTVVAPADELLLMESWPLATPAAFG
jgi:hypothetical protein